MAKKTERQSVAAASHPDTPPDRSPYRRARQLLVDSRDLFFSICQDQGFSRRELAGLDHFLLKIPLRGGDRLSNGDEDADAFELVAGIGQQILETARGQTAYQPGHVYCFQCDSPNCIHSRPTDRADTFLGYSATGKPSWMSFTNLCLQRQDGRIDRVYAEPPEVIALILWSYELSEGFLPAFRRNNLGYNLLGQVVAGLVPGDLRQSRHPSDRIALTFQIVQTRTGSKGQRLRLNLIGLTPDEIAAAVSQTSPRDPPERLRRLLLDTRRRLDSAGVRLKSSPQREEPAELMRQVEPILVKLRADVEHIFRPQRQRTQHAQQRHRSGDRPTANALTDARNASDEKLLLDTTRDTVVVIGPKGRAHVFSRQGRHVTSLQVQPGEVDRKTALKRWRSMSREEILAFRNALEQGGPER
ncbi:MAG: hypothetical protein JW797_15180 [Bradymonadales bacterium]|nr:hypothetical protein [Bradymonadales bacterium]